VFYLQKLKSPKFLELRKKVSFYAPRRKENKDEERGISYLFFDESRHVCDGYACIYIYIYTRVVEEKEIDILSYFLNERLSLSRALYKRSIDSNSFSLSFLHIARRLSTLEESGRLKSPRRFF